MRCDQCEAVVINGVFCHEIGCPNMRKVYRDGEWISVYKCRECGSTVEKGEACCSDD